ncbi:hypothetical protein OEZ86_000411 [Tetradesmus obliquus]|nr:hypothetical protein OEZ86_000411 [Tetradesmus obliquus]
MCKNSSDHTPADTQTACSKAEAATLQAAAAAGSGLGSSSSSSSSGSSSNGQHSKYLTFDEYVELQQQYKQQQAALQHQAPLEAPQAASEAAQQPSESNDEGSTKRVPWNKGRKHSALTIARIVSGNARARERPEVRAKVEAYSRSRVGVQLSPEHREHIRQGNLEARMEKLRNMTPEEDAAMRAQLSQRSKLLWQDPEYAAKTTAAIREAAAKRSRKPRLAQQQQQQQQREGETDDVTEPSSSSTTNSRRASTPRVRASCSSAAVSRSSSSSSTAEEPSPLPEQQQQQPVRPKVTKKERAAAAADQQRLLQQQVSRLLQMRHVIGASESTVAQLQANLQAFQNDPQAHQVASATMQQAQAHLATLHSQLHSSEDDDDDEDA